jgi:signal transduction histidine kinase
MTGDKAGNIYLAEDRSLLHLRDGTLVTRIAWPETGRSDGAKVLLSDDEGGVWLGFWSDGGIAYLKDTQVRASYTVANGLTEGPVADLHLGWDGALWIATEWGGLNRLKDARISALTSRNGLPCDIVHWAKEDDDGSFWLYTACGLVRIRRAELEAWIADPKRRVQTTVWDAADGVRLRSFAASSYGPRVAKTSDGKLCFVTGLGVQVIDPRHLTVNQLPPPVHIEEIVADKNSYWRNIMGTAAPKLRLPARTHDLQIDFTALSLVAQDKVHFKYKLEGQDHDWREVVNTRGAQYTNLAPSSYRFRVIASNNSGVWNEQGASLEFSIDPAYYETRWFRALSAAAFVALLWAAYRLRVGHLHHQFDMTLEARMSERTRIARELHDTLLQSFHGSLLRLQTVSLLLPERPIEAKGKLDSALEQAAGAITEGRDAVQGLRTSTVERNDLALAISTLGEELEKDPMNHGRATFRVAVDGQARDVHPIVRDEIYKIAAEALHNAFHHAQATQVEVEIHYRDDQLRLRVRDDGKGIDAAVLSSLGLEGHYGLRGMRERAALIKGKLAVWSEVDAGTEVELCVPGGNAYATARKGSWLARTFSAKG